MEVSSATYSIRGVQTCAIRTLSADSLMSRLPLIEGIMEKKRHHYVPSGLTKRFCDPDDSDRIYYYDALYDRIYPSAPRDAFVERDLHTIIRNDGTRDRNSVEDLLAKFESNGIDGLRSLIDNGSICDDVRRSIANIWALQLVRTPVIRATFEAFLKETLRTIGLIVDRGNGFPPVPESLLHLGKSYTELMQNRVIDVDITLRQATMLSFDAFPSIAELLLQMRWYLIKSNAPDYFLLSDNPCSIFDPHYGLEYTGIGLCHPGVEIALPIGRNHCLVAAWKEVPRPVRGTQRRVAQLNRRAALFGERFFVFPVSSSQMLRMIKVYSGGVPEAEVYSKENTCSKNAIRYYIRSSLRFLSHKHDRLYRFLKPVL